MSTPADRPTSRASAATSADPFTTAPNTPVPQLDSMEPGWAQAQQYTEQPQSPKAPTQPPVASNEEPAETETHSAAAEEPQPRAEAAPAPAAAAPPSPDSDVTPASSSASDTSDNHNSTTAAAAANLGAAGGAEPTLVPPSAPFARAVPTGQTPGGSLLDTSPRSSFPSASASTNNSAPLLTETEKAQVDANNSPSKAEEGGAAAASAAYAADSSSPRDGNKHAQGGRWRRRSMFKRPVCWLLALLALAVLVIVIVVPVYFKVVKPKKNAAAAVNPESPVGATTGGDGSVVVMANGTSFTYQNSFGGFWVEDPTDPFNNDAQPNSWTPPLNTSWTWGKDRINGVNLGGLFVLEPFIVPSLFQKYNGSVDEWTLSTLMAQDTASGGLSQLEDHYNTFITEQDIAEIAGAGLNWIRVPIPFWAIEKWDFEPFLEKVCWPYILRVLQWARKYGLRVDLDLHTIPGSQNGYNHSGKLGTVNFLNGVMGLANAERTLDYIRIIAEFISQPEWQPVVPVFSIVNEALLQTIGKDQLTTFYLRAHDMVRGITGYGEGHGAYIAIHDGFVGTANWTGFLQGSDRVILDTHPYFAFDGAPNDAPLATSEGVGVQAGGTWPQTACSAWAAGMNESRAGFGVTIAGEFSNGYNECGLFLVGTGVDTTTSGECELFVDWQSWNQSMKAGFMEYTLASMDALGDYFFWTWKIGPSQSGAIESPQWSYQLGLAQGWMPKDPRTAIGTCASLGVSGPIFNGTFAPWQTGGSGAGTIAPSSVSSFGQYPPSSINGLTLGAVQSLLPTYTSTSAVPSLPAPTSLRTDGGSWYDSSDTGLAPTEVAGCSYTWDAWDANSATMPTALCTGAGEGGAGARRARVTPPPAERRGR